MIFGSTTYVRIHSYKMEKLEPRAIKCIFIGYSSIQRDYECYHPPFSKFHIFCD